MNFQEMCASWKKKRRTEQGFKRGMRVLHWRYCFQRELMVQGKNPKNLEQSPIPDYTKRNEPANFGSRYSIKQTLTTGLSAFDTAARERRSILEIKRKAQKIFIFRNRNK